MRQREDWTSVPVPSVRLVCSEMRGCPHSYPCHSRTNTCSHASSNATAPRSDSGAANAGAVNPCPADSSTNHCSSADSCAHSPDHYCSAPDTDTHARTKYSDPIDDRGHRDILQRDL